MKYFSLLAFFCVLTNLNAQNDAFSQYADSLVAAKMEAYRTAGAALGVVKDGEIIHLKGYGLANVDSKKPVTEHSLFHVASISKLFTALAVMELVIEDKLSLDDKLTSILTNLKYKDEVMEEINLRQMLDHSSGIPDIWNYQWASGRKTEDALRNYVENKRLRTVYAPGTEYKYSNLAYDILGVVVEEASGMSFEQYIKQKWLTPSGMKNSDFRYFETDEQLRTSPHVMKSGKVRVQEVYPYNREHAPSSTLNSSAADLSSWMIYFMNTLKTSDHKAVYQSMLKPASAERPYAGLGFHLSEMMGYERIEHYGGDDGYRSYLYMLPEKDMGFVLLVNSEYGDDIRYEVLHNLGGWLLRH